MPFLLTSNKGLGALAALAGMEIDDAHHGRLIGVPLPGFGGRQRHNYARNSFGGLLHSRFFVRRTIGKGAGGKGRCEQVVAVRAAAFD